MFIETLTKDPKYFMAVVITVVVSICLHELAHGAVAVWRGDRTPIEAGHMTPNPAVHMGVMSVVMLLLAGIAWGSMPVDPRRLRGRYAPALVAVAGPLCNVLLGVLAIAGLGLWLRFDPRTSADLPDQLANLRYLMVVFGVTNFALALFNLIPVPPLDGSRILSNFSGSYTAMLESLASGGGLSLVFLLVFFGASKLTNPLANEAAFALLQFARGE